jgi:hypothetical protein
MSKRSPFDSVGLWLGGTPCLRCSSTYLSLNLTTDWPAKPSLGELKHFPNKPPAVSRGLIDRAAD